MDYEERLCFRKLPTLVYRRHMGDLIEMFKMSNVLSCDIIPQIELRIHLLARYKRTLETNFDIQIEYRFKSELYFTLRCVARVWNGLIEDIVSAVRVGGSFKKKLDKFRENHPMKYDSTESV